CVAVSALSKNQPADNSVKNTISDELRNELSKEAEKTDIPATADSTSNNSAQQENGVQTSTTLPTQKQRLTLAQAELIALKDAGLVNDAENVVFTEQKLDKENNGDVYDIEFYSGKTQWEYEIDAYTGEIVSYSCEPNDR
ncbi:MAG: PepSY domain-containing protein, partial [Eubacterium sp.]